MGESLIPVTWTGFHQPERRPAGLAAGTHGDGSRVAETVGWSVGVSSRKKQLGFQTSGTRAPGLQTESDYVPLATLIPARYNFTYF